MGSEWRSGGYFLMGPVAAGALTDHRLPKLTWSLSACVSDAYPDENCLKWVASPRDRVEQISQRLQLSPEAFADLETEVTRLCDQNLFRWPHVFATVSAAREFHERWLTMVPNVRLLGIALHASDVSAYLAANDGGGTDEGVLSLLKEDREPEDGEPWGFEVLGTEMGGSFHTYLCHGLAGELMDELQVAFNAHGLIADRAGATAACDWINMDEVGAEPVPWYPWRVAHYALE